MHYEEHPPGADDAPRLGWAWFLAPILCAALFRDLWAPDEPRYAMVSKWIYDHGEFLVLRRCGVLYPDKPPLVYWLSGLLGWLSGWHVPAMRLVSVAATAGTAWWTSRFARDWLGAREAQWAPVLFLGFTLILWNGGRLALDPLLTFGCVGALYFASKPARDSREAARFALLAGVLLGVGMFSKGPVALVNTGFPLLAWRFTGLRPGGARASKGAFVAALGLAVIPVAAWAIAAALREPALWRPLFLGQHLERAAKGVNHPGPPWQHLLEVPAFVLPWTAPVVIGLVDGYRAWRARRLGDESRSALARIWWWAAALFVFFSAIPTKRELYLMCAYPAFALLGAHYVVRALRQGAIARWSAVLPLAVFALVGALLAAGTPLAETMWPRAPELLDDEREFHRMLTRFPELAWRGAAAGSTFLVGAALGWRAWRQGKLAAWANGVAITWTVGASVALALLGPVMDVVKSERELARLVAQHPQDPLEIPCYDTHPEAPRFYGAGPCVSADPRELLDGRFEARAEREGRDFIAIVRESRWERTPDEQRARFVVVARIRVGSRPLVLIGLP